MAFQPGAISIGTIEAGHRVIVPDLIGFGKSDKFVDKTNYSYVHHIETIKYLVNSLDLRDATFLVKIGAE